MWNTVWLAAAVLATTAAPEITAAPETSASAPATAAAEPLTLTFADLLAPGPALRPSPRLASLAGRRVRLSGYMAELEEAPHGAFYLTAHPVRCDEGGAGTGDLPPDAVRVEVRSAVGQEIPFYPGRLEVTGRLETGVKADDSGRPSFFRLTLDRPEDLGRPAAAAAAPPPHTP